LKNLTHHKNNATHKTFYHGKLFSQEKPVPFRYPVNPSFVMCLSVRIRSKTITADVLLTQHKFAEYLVKLLVAHDGVENKFTVN